MCVFVCQGESRLNEGRKKLMGQGSVVLSGLKTEICSWLEGVKQCQLGKGR